MKITNHEKKDIILLTQEEKESYENQQICYVCEEEFVLIKIKRIKEKAKSHRS